MKYIELTFLLMADQIILTSFLTLDNLKNLRKKIINLLEGNLIRELIR